jgi:hypothetical protein
MVHPVELATLALQRVYKAHVLHERGADHLHRDAKLLVEIGDPFSDVPPDADGAIGAIRYLRALVAEGVAPADAVPARWAAAPMPAFRRAARRLLGQLPSAPR